MPNDPDEEGRVGNDIEDSKDLLEAEQYTLEWMDGNEVDEKLLLLLLSFSEEEDGRGTFPCGAILCISFTELCTTVVVVISFDCLRTPWSDDASDSYKKVHFF